MRIVAHSLYFLTMLRNYDLLDANLDLHGKGCMHIGFGELILRLGIAILAGGIIGYERETRRHPAGLRTHILVCVGACVVSLIECQLAEQFLDVSKSGVSFTMGRLSAQVISGIGFLGAGTIITTKRNIVGLTTAASLWAIGCLGIAAGMGLYSLCVIGTILILIVLTLIKQLFVGHIYKIVEVSFRHRRETLGFLNDYFTTNHIRIQNVDFRVDESPDGNIYTNVYTLDLPRKLDSAMMINDITEYGNVQKVRTRDP